MVEGGQTSKRKDGTWERMAMLVRDRIHYEAELPNGSGVSCEGLSEVDEAGAVIGWLGDEIRGSESGEQQLIAGESVC